MRLLFRNEASLAVNSYEHGVFYLYRRVVPIFMQLLNQWDLMHPLRLQQSVENVVSVLVMDWLVRVVETPRFLLSLHIELRLVFENHNLLLLDFGRGSKGLALMGIVLLL